MRVVRSRHAVGQIFVHNLCDAVIAHVFRVAAFAFVHERALLAFRFERDVARVAAEFTGELRVVVWYAVEAFVFQLWFLFLLSVLIFSSRSFVLVLVLIGAAAFPRDAELLRVRALPARQERAHLPFHKTPIITRLAASLPGVLWMRLRHSLRQDAVLQNQPFLLLFFRNQTRPLLRKRAQLPFRLNLVITRVTAPHPRVLLVITRHAILQIVKRHLHPVLLPFIRHRARPILRERAYRLPRRALIITRPATPPPGKLRIILRHPVRKTTFLVGLTIRIR